jgi:hypothetical protein
MNWRILSQAFQHTMVSSIHNPCIAQNILFNFSLMWLTISLLIIVAEVQYASDEYIPVLGKKHTETQGLNYIILEPLQFHLVFYCIPH